MLACYWMAQDGGAGVPSNDLADRYNNGFERATAEELIAIVCQVGTQGKEALNQKFRAYINKNA